MLVLQRRADERVVITIPPSRSTTTVYVEVCDIDRNRTRLGFDGPDEVIFMREELIPAHQREAAK